MLVVKAQPVQLININSTAAVLLKSRRDFGCSVGNQLKKGVDLTVAYLGGKLPS